MTDLHRSRPFLWTLFIFFALTWFFVLGIRTLVPPDEGRYAEIAREMFLSGDWITTRLNGIQYFEKPPLQVWMTALTFKLFGLGDWQARLWTGLSGFFGIVLVAYAGRKVFSERIGFYAALVLASSLFWGATSQFNSLDMGLSGMMTLTLCALLIAQRDTAHSNERRNWMLICWAGMALAVLSKGLIGLILPAAALVIYTVLARDWTIWSRLHLLKGSLLFFAITTPWFVLVAQRNPDFLQFFFVHEHVERFFTKSHHREGPWHYFFGILLAGILPWLGVLPHSFAQGFRNKAFSIFKPKLFLLVWAVFIFLFFSYSNSKLPGYILPIFPALALLIGAHLEKASRKSRMLAGGLVAIIGTIGLAFIPKIAKMNPEPLVIPLFQAFQPWVIAACFVAMVGGALSVLYAKQLRRDLGVFTLAVTGFMAGQFILTGYEPYGNYRAGLPLVAVIQAELTPQTKLYAVGQYEQSLTFYLRRTMTLVDFKDEFTFGLGQEPHLSIPSREAFIEQWRDGSESIAITSPKIFEDFKNSGVPMRVIAQDSRRVVISNNLKNDLGKL